MTKKATEYIYGKGAKAPLSVMSKAINTDTLRQL